MKRNTRRSISFALAVVWLCNSTAVLGAVIGTGNNVAPSNPARVSDRLIVKFKANSLPKGLSVSQINAELRRPLSAQVMGTLQAATGMNIAESHALATGAHVMVVPAANSNSLAQAISTIAKLPNVEYVEEDRIVTAQAVTSDTLYSLLWGMQPASAVAGASPGLTGSYGADFEHAWNTTTGTGVVVAVVDTGITAHPDLVGSAGTVVPATGNLVSSGYDFISDCRVRGSCVASTPAASAVVAASPDASDTGDFVTASEAPYLGAVASNSSWHGTHVAGTIAAIGNNAQGVIGGAYGVKVLPVRVLGKGGGYLTDVLEGLQWAAGVHPTVPNPNPAKVINLSLGGVGACSQSEQTAIDAAVAAGAVVVVAAGNSNGDVAGFAPAGCNNVITVGAIGKDGSRASYSNYSSHVAGPAARYVTLAAPGGDYFATSTFDSGIASTLNTGTTTPVAATFATASYFYSEGTSMATPHVSAAVALMLARNPARTPAQVKTVLSSSASLTAFPTFSASAAANLLKTYATFDCVVNNDCGAGILNAKLAVQNSIQSLSANTGTADFGAVSSVTGNNITVTLTNNSLASVKLGATTVTGSNSGFFSVGADTCQGYTIAPSATCQITVSYAPTAAGAHSAVLTAPTTTAGVATIVGLAGSAGAMLAPANPTLTAPTVTVGKSTTVDVTFSNGNPWSVSTGALSLSQPGTMAASSDNCGNVTLAASASCTATIAISPKVAGTYSGTVSLTPTVGGAPAVATISGTANAAPAPAPSSGGGGGCSIMPAGANPDASLLLAMLAVAGYWLRRRIVRSAD